MMVSNWKDWAPHIVNSPPCEHQQRSAQLAAQTRAPRLPSARSCPAPAQPCDKSLCGATLQGCSAGTCWPALSDAVLCSPVQPCAVKCSPVQPCAVLCSPVQPCAALRSPAAGDRRKQRYEASKLARQRRAEQTRTCVPVRQRRPSGIHTTTLALLRVCGRRSNAGRRPELLDKGQALDTGRHR